MKFVSSFLFAFSTALVVAAVGFVLSWFRPWLCVPVLALNSWLAYGIFKDLYEPSIYDSMQADFGGHAVAAHAALTAILIGAPLLGAFVQLRRRPRKANH